MRKNTITTELDADAVSRGIPVATVTIDGQTIETVADLTANRTAYQDRQDERDIFASPTLREIWVNMVTYDQIKSESRLPTDELDRRLNGSKTTRGMQLPGALITYEGQSGADAKYNFTPAESKKYGTGLLIQRIWEKTWTEDMEDEFTGKKSTVARTKTQWDYVGFCPEDRLGDLDTDRVMSRLRGLRAAYYAAINEGRDQAASDRLSHDLEEEEPF